MNGSLSERAPDPVVFSRHVGLVQAQVRRERGAHAALMAAAHEDPEGLATSLVALGGVLLDLAAGAFAMTPEQILDKLADNVEHHLDAPPALPAL